MIKIGAITVGQAPRPDITGDVKSVLGDDFEIIEVGIWDGFTKEEILRNYGPEEGKDVLPTIMADGTEISYAEYHCYPRIQACVDKLEKEGVELIYMYCAGSFPQIKTNVPLMFPRDLMISVVQATTVNKKIIEMMPAGNIYEQQKRFWSQYVDGIELIVADPHSKNTIYDDLDKVAELAAKSDADTIVMDCMGYNLEHMKYLKKKVTQRVVLPRTLIAAMIKEILRRE